MALSIISPNSQLVIKKVSCANARWISTYLPCKYAIQSHGKIYYTQQGSKEAETNVKPADWETARPFDEIPGPKPLPIFGNLHKFMFGEFKDIHIGEVNRKLRNQHGNIVSLTGVFGVPNSIKLFDPEDIEKLFRNDGIWPYRILMPTVDEYKLNIRKDWFKNYPGIISVQGEEWYNVRNKLNPILMQPKAISIYTDPIEAIANDIVAIIGKLSKSNSKNEMPADFDQYIQKYALEASAYVAFNQRIGCLDEHMNELTQQFLNTLNELFGTLQDLDYSPLGLFYKKFNMKPWTDSIDRLDFLFTSGKEFIRRAKLLMEQRDGTDTSMGVFERLMKIDEEFAVTFSIELLIAGVETTSKTIGSTLYLLAKNKEVQKKLQKELKELLPTPDSPITKDILSQASYLKAVLKESMRLLPVSLGLLRITTKDLVLGGYQIPKGTTVEVSNFVVGTSEENYKRPSEFIPERWLKSDNMCPMELSHKNTSPFTALPFGFGSRSCVGKRLALLDVEMFLAKVLRNYEVDWLREDMKLRVNLTLGCGDPLQFKMTPVQN